MIATCHKPDHLYFPVFDDLFLYVHQSLLTEAGIDPDAADFDVVDAIRVCNGKLTHVEQFCTETGVGFESLRCVLIEAGAGCDCEVLLNATMHFDEQQELPRKW
jgi:hypothetical protein